MNLYSALKSIFTANTSAAATGARIPCLNNLGNVASSVTYNDMVVKMKEDVRKVASGSVGPVLWKIWEITGNGNAVLKIFCYRVTTSAIYGEVEMIGGRYTASSSNNDKTRVLSAKYISAYFKLYKKHEGTTMTYYAYLSTTSKNLGLQVTQIMGKEGNLIMEVSDEDISTLTDIDLTCYDLTIVVSSNGYATFNGKKFTDGTNTFNLVSGSSPVIFLTPNSGYRIKSVKKNGTDVTSSASDTYAVGSMSADVTVTIEYEADT